MFDSHITDLLEEARELAGREALAANHPQDLLFSRLWGHKFAEMIVKECAVVANRAENDDAELRCMYDVITQHFGIKD